MIKLMLKGGLEVELDQDTGVWSGDPRWARYLNLAVPAFLFPPSPAEGAIKRSTQALAGKEKLSGSEIEWPTVSVDDGQEKVY